MKQFTDPVLNTTGNDWYVFFQFTHEGETYKRKIRENINREKDRKARREKGKALVELCREWLENGWNPITDPKREIYFAALNAGISPEETGLPLKDALNFALSKMKTRLATKTYLGYSSKYSFFVQAAANAGIDKLPVNKIQRKHIKMIMEQIKSTRTIANKTYNNYLGTLSSFFAELLQWDMIEYNPASRVKPLDEPETNKYVPYTDAEKKAIQDHLFKHHKPFYNFLMLVYHTGIRPKEALAMKIRDVNLPFRVITLVPNKVAENTKTNKVRRVPINDDLLTIFTGMNLDKYPDDYFVFGSPCGPNGNRGQGSLPIGEKPARGTGTKTGKSGARRGDYFMPSQTQVKRDTATKLWKAIIKDETGLGIDKYLYAMKHTGADDKILAGVDLDSLRYLYGHSSKQMTEIYAKGIKGLYQKNIIQNSPSFVTKKKTG